MVEVPGIHRLRNPTEAHPGFYKIPSETNPIGRCKLLALLATPSQLRPMRGSPLLRSILLAMALAATGLGLARVTSSRQEEPTVRPAAAPPVALPGGNAVPFRLVLSAPSAQVEIDTGKVLRPLVDDSPLSGVLELDPRNPRVSLVIRWKQPTAPGERRFAKLTLEPPGQETFTRVFDADGDIDDFLELPLPTAP